MFWRDAVRIGCWKNLLSALFLFFMLPACSPLKLVNATLPEGGWQQVSAVSYGADPRQSVDIYLPVNKDAKGLLIFFYGGGWDSGEKRDYRFVAAAFAEAGYAVAIPDYRLYPQVRYPDFLQDAADAVAMLARHPDLAALVPERTFIGGHSAGAWITMMLALQPQWLRDGGVDPDRLAGAIGLAGPYDFDPLLYPTTRQSFGHVKRFEVTQPVHFARANAPPLLLMHGLDDTTVEPVDSRILAERVQTAGGRAATRFYEGVDHTRLVAALAPQLNWLAPVQSEMLLFMEAELPVRPAE
jgi:acetyl esterase/lipase